MNKMYKPFNLYSKKKYDAAIVINKYIYGWMKLKKIE